MTREHAIIWIKEIQNGEGVNMNKFPADMKGEIAKKLWSDATFSYGVEYGVMLALMEVFNITRDDL